MKEIKIENICLSLLSAGDCVRVKSDNKNIILSNQNVENVSELIKHNFKVVNNHYKSMIDNGGGNFNEINVVSIAIVLHYLFMYNSWRRMYKKQENKDLRFNEKDFRHPSTHDILFNYFKTKYPGDWEGKCAVLLEMDEAELKAYYKSRVEFYNK